MKPEDTSMFDTFMGQYQRVMHQMIHDLGITKEDFVNTEDEESSFYLDGWYLYLVAREQGSDIKPGADDHELMHTGYKDAEAHYNE